MENIKHYTTDTYTQSRIVQYKTKEDMHLLN